MVVAGALPAQPPIITASHHFGLLSIFVPEGQAIWAGSANRLTVRELVSIDAAIS